MNTKTQKTVNNADLAALLTPITQLAGILGCFGPSVSLKTKKKPPKTVVRIKLDINSLIALTMRNLRRMIKVMINFRVQISKPRKDIANVSKDSDIQQAIR